jgi:hypothetical protein
VPPAPATAPPPKAPATADFEDNFDLDSAGGAPAHWTVGSGPWTVAIDPRGQGHVLFNSGLAQPGFAVILADGTSFGDFDASVNVSLQSGSGFKAGGIVFHAQDASNFALVRANAQDGSVALVLVQNGEGTPYGGDFQGAQLGGWHGLRVRVQGTHVQAWWDGAPALDLQQASGSAGKIGLSTRDDTHADFDDVRVSKL